MADPKRKIGGSDIAAVLGKSKWQSPLDVYMRLTDPASRLEKSGVDIDRGRYLEPAILQWTNKKLEGEGLEFDKPSMLVHPEWEWATVSPDGITGRHPAVTAVPQAVLEIKAPRRDDISQWGEEGSDEVPTDALLQTHWSVMIANAREGVVAALLGGELRIFRVKRDPDLEKRMLERAKEFVENHVLPGIPPEPTFGDDRNVFYLHPRDTKPHLQWAELTDTQREAVGEYLGAYAEESAAMKRLEGWEPAVKMLIADHGGVVLPDGRRIDWSVRKGSTKWKEVAHTLKNALVVPEEEWIRLTMEHKGDDSRSLRPYEAKKSKK